MDLSKLLDELYDDDGREGQNGDKAPTAVPEPPPSPPPAAAAPPPGPAPGLDPLAADPELAAWLADMAEQPEGADESAAAPGPGLEVVQPEPESAVRLDEAVPELEPAEPEPEPEPEPYVALDPVSAVEAETALPVQDEPVAEPEPAELPTQLEPGRKWRRADDDILPGRTARADDRSAASGGERRGRWWGLRRRS